MQRKEMKKVFDRQMIIDTYDWFLNEYSNVDEIIENHANPWMWAREDITQEEDHRLEYARMLKKYMNKEEIKRLHPPPIPLPPASKLTWLDKLKIFIRGY